MDKNMNEFSVPGTCLYSDRHEWVAKQENGNYRIGLTHFALDLLGELVFVELPQVDEAFGAGDPIGIVEAVKAASDVFTPISGKVVAVNEAALLEPKKIENAPYVDGWLLELAPDDQTEVDLAKLMSAQKYNAIINK